MRTRFAAKREMKVQALDMQSQWNVACTKLRLSLSIIVASRSAKGRPLKAPATMKGAARERATLMLHSC